MGRSNKDPDPAQAVWLAWPPRMQADGDGPCEPADGGRALLPLPRHARRRQQRQQTLPKRTKRATVAQCARRNRPCRALTPALDLADPVLASCLPPPRPAWRLPSHVAATYSRSMPYARAGNCRQRAPASRSGAPGRQGCAVLLCVSKCYCMG